MDVPNPFDRRMTNFNRFLAAGFVLSLCAIAVNGLSDAAVRAVPNPF